MTKSEHTSHHNYENPIQKDERTGRFMKTTKFTKDPRTDSPFKNLNEDAAHDIRSNEEITIPPKSSAIISTGLKLEIPNGHVGLIWSRSGLSVKNKIEVGAGCIDSNFRGEIKVHLYNFNDTEFKISINDRIAQILIMPVNLERFVEVESLDNTDRNENGFGSSGVK